MDWASPDRNGEAVRAEIMSQGAECIASNVYTTHLQRKHAQRVEANPQEGKIRWVPSETLLDFTLQQGVSIPTRKN
jgi:hypothetical protein